MPIGKRLARCSRALLIGTARFCMLAVPWVATDALAQVPDRATGPGTTPVSPTLSYNTAVSLDAPAQRETADAAAAVTPILINLGNPPSRTPPRDDAAPRARGDVDAIDGIVTRGADGEEEPGAPIRLHLRAGERMDAAWIYRQFVRNRLDGVDAHAEARATRVSALLELINLAYFRHGYVSSGVIPAPGDVDGTKFHLIVGLLRKESFSLEPIGARQESAEEDIGDISAGINAGFITDRLMGSDRDRPFNITSFEKRFLLLAEDPALRTLHAQVGPGSARGAVSLNVTNVLPSPRWTHFLELANSRSPSVGGDRVAVGGVFRNVPTMAGSTLTYEAGVTEGLVDGAIAFETPLFAPSWTGTLRADYNEASVVDRALEALDITSTSWSVDAGVSRRWQTPLVYRADGRWKAARTVTVGALVSHKETETTLLGMPFSFSPGAVDGKAAITAARVTTDFVDRGRNRVVAVSAVASKGLDGSGSDVSGAVTPSPSFSSFALRFSSAMRLNETLGTQVRLRAGGQLADGLLYTSERFSAGGANSVRGYRENILLADTGAQASVELAQPFDLTRVGAPRTGDRNTFEALLFADHATARNEAGPKPFPARLGSVGVGLSWARRDKDADETFRVSLAYGYGLVDVGNAKGDDLQDDGFHFRVIVRPNFGALMH